MANPQLEDGYIRIANELYEAILIYPFSKRELLIVLAVIRRTYGYNKKTDIIAMYQLAKATGIGRNQTQETVQALTGKGVLTVVKTGTVVRGQEVNRIGLNKIYSEWSTVPKMGTVPKLDRTQNGDGDRTQNGCLTVPKLAHIKDKVKDNKRQEKKTTIPQWIDPEVWGHFLDHRKGLKSPMSEHAKKLLVGKLERLRADGHDPTELLNTAILSGWKSVYPENKQQRASGNEDQRGRNRAERFHDQLKAHAANGG